MPHERGREVVRAGSSLPAFPREVKVSPRRPDYGPRGWPSEKVRAETTLRTLTRLSSAWKVHQARAHEMRALLLLLFLLVVVPARADELRAGAATVVIT